MFQLLTFDSFWETTFQNKYYSNYMTSNFLFCHLLIVVKKQKQNSIRKSFPFALFLNQYFPNFLSLVKQ